MAQVAVRRSREKVMMAALSAREKVTPVGSQAPSTGLRAPFLGLGAGAEGAALSWSAGGAAAVAVEVRWRLDMGCGKAGRGGRCEGQGWWWLRCVERDKASAV